MTGAEIADDPAIVTRLEHLYHEIEAGDTPIAILLPWLPSWGIIRKLFATKGIYDILTRAIDARLRGGKSRGDTLQMLLDNEDERMVIIGFMMGLIPAGAHSTSTIGLQFVFWELNCHLTFRSASWLLVYLGTHPEWRAKARAEVESLMFANSSTPYKAGTSLRELSVALSQIELSAWEGATPVLDAVISETTRIAQPHAAVRKNVGPEIHIDGKLVPSGYYVVYPFSDVHLNEELYPDPWKFDPGRPRPDGRFSYIGWGGGMVFPGISTQRMKLTFPHTGRIVCLGQRLAKVQMKLLLAMFLLGTEFSIVDKEGKLPEVVPRPNWNDVQGCKPPKDSCFIQYKVNC